jgi:hypothetical protein
MPYSYVIFSYVHDVLTEEFLNIGIALYCSELNFFKTKITNKIRRISDTFEGFNGYYYKNVIKYLKKPMRKIFTSGVTGRGPHRVFGSHRALFSNRALSHRALPGAKLVRPFRAGQWYLRRAFFIRFTILHYGIRPEHQERRNYFHCPRGKTFTVQKSPLG